MKSEYDFFRETVCDFSGLTFPSAFVCVDSKVNRFILDLGRTIKV